MNTFTYILIALLSLTLINIFEIGKERKPLKAGSVFFGIIVNAIIGFIIHFYL